MAAKDWLQPQQLKLFMTGTEWKSEVTHSTDGPIPALWDQKEAEARTPRSPSLRSVDPGPNQLTGGIYDHMRTNGYQRDLDAHEVPTVVLEDAPNGKSVRTVQSDGHHRVAAAAAIERDTGKPVYIPTNYVDNTSVGKKRHRKSLGLE